MAENDRLLAHLSPSFTPQTENIAVEALGYILNKYAGSREGLDDVVRSGVRHVNPVAKVRTQASGQDGTRPDLVGVDEGAAERVLIEAKFWAELTPRQPDAYLDRLPDDGPAVLLFVAPEERIGSLWRELRSRAEGAGKKLSDVDAERKCMSVDGTQRHLLLASWTGLLDRISARTRGNQDADADIQQLRGLTVSAEDGRFQPIRDNREEFGPDSRHMRDMKRIIEAATERGITDGWASRKGLNRTPRSYGYGRYLKLGGSGVVWLGVNTERWERDGQTPLWIDGRYVGDAALEAIGTGLNVKVDGHWVPIMWKKDAEYDDELDGVVSTLRNIARVFENRP